MFVLAVFPGALPVCALDLIWYVLCWFGIRLHATHKHNSMHTSFSDYLVPPPHSVARAAARRAHDLTKTVPDLGSLTGRALADFMIKVGIRVCSRTGTLASFFAECAVLCLVSHCVCSTHCVVEQCNVDASVAQAVAIDNAIPGADLVCCTIENFTSIGIAITDPVLQPFRDAILAYWDK